MRAPKTGILVVPFGTSHIQAERSCIAPREEALAAAFPECVARRAWTSGQIIKKLRERDGRHVDDVAGAVRWFVERGFDRLCIQPLHLLAGHELYRKIVEVARGMRGSFARLAIGMPGRRRLSRPSRPIPGSRKR